MRLHLTLALMFALGATSARADRIVRIADHGGGVITVHAGDTVRWEGDFRAHPLTSSDPGFTTVRDGTAFEKKYDVPGVYRYHCEAHPSAVGEVRVVARTSWAHHDCCGLGDACCSFGHGHGCCF